MSVLQELYAAISVSLLFFSMPLFDTLNGKFETFQKESDTKKGWAPITGAIGILFATVSIPLIGRKNTFIITASAYVLGWILITYTKSCEVADYFQVIVVGHAILAFCIGVTYPLVSVYLIEIVQPGLYGIFSVIPSIFFNVGTLTYNIVHDHFTYTHVAFFAALLHVIFLVLTFFFDESPQWLAAKKLKMELINEKRPQKKEIKGPSGKPNEMESVLLEMVDTPTTVVEWTMDNELPTEPGIENDIDEQLPVIHHKPKDINHEPEEINHEKLPTEEEETRIIVVNTNEIESSLIDLVNIPKFSVADNFNALTVALQLMFLANFCGMSTIQLHMVKFYEAIDTTSDENHVFLLIDKIKLGGSLASLVMIVLVTRKNLLYFSFCTMALSLIAIGSYFFIKNENPSDNIVADYQWIPFVLSVFFIIGYSVGIGSIVWMVMAEVLPHAYRDILATIATSFHWICIYGIFILFKNNRGKGLLYTDVLFWMHGFICIYGIVFVKSYMPDAKGCSLEDLIGILTAES